MTTKVQTFLYKNIIDLTFLEGKRINVPMFRKSIKLFKGIGNTISFEVKNADRKPVKIFDGSIRFFIFNEETDEVMLDKYVVIDDEIKGKYHVRVEAGEMLNWDAGYYRFSAIYTDFECVEHVLFTDLVENGTGQVEVIDSAFPKAIPAVEVLPDNFIQRNDYFVTGRYEGDAKQNYRDGLHTIAIYLNEFSGKIWVQGSLEEYPTQEDQFFDIPLTVDRYVEVTDSSELLDFNFEGNYIWVRFKYQPDISNTGTIDKILYKH